MRHKLAGILFFAVILVAEEAQTLSAWAQGHNHGSHDQLSHTHQDPEVSGDKAAITFLITIRSDGYELRRDGQVVGPEISLIAGRSAVMSLRNEDTIPHDFVSALFTRMELHFMGRATGMFRKEAAGFRLKPGESLTVQFVPQLSDFPTMYDVIWCSHHREHLVVVTEDRQPGS